MPRKAQTKILHTFKDKPLTTITIDMSKTANEDKLAIGVKKFQTLLKAHKNINVEYGTLVNQLRGAYKDGMLDLNRQSTTGGVTPRRNFGDCKCTHPPSFGRCLFGACISVFKNGLKITINI